MTTMTTILRILIQVLPVVETRFVTSGAGTIKCGLRDKTRCHGAWLMARVSCTTQIDIVRSFGKVGANPWNPTTPGRERNKTGYPRNNVV